MTHTYIQETQQRNHTTKQAHYSPHFTSSSLPQWRIIHFTHRLFPHVVIFH